MKSSSVGGKPTLAFTLVESLVVVAVIAILASFLLPVLANGKEQGRKAACINNFRQLHLAWQMYIDDDKESHLPYNDLNEFAGTDESYPNWVSGWLSPKDGTRDNTNAVKLIKAHGGIGVYLNDPKVFKCPSDRSITKIAGKVYPRVRSVAMNNFMGTQIGLDPAQWLSAYYPTTAHLAARPPVETGFVFIDTHEDSVAVGMFLVSSPAVGDWWNHFPASRHNGGATLSFTDGHVICHKWLDPRTRQPVTRDPNYLYGRHQPGNRDIRWLQERSTVAKKFGP